MSPDQVTAATQWETLSLLTSENEEGQCWNPTDSNQLAARIILGKYIFVTNFIHLTAQIIFIEETLKKMLFRHNKKLHQLKLKKEDIFRYV